MKSSEVHLFYSFPISKASKLRLVSAVNIGQIKSNMNTRDKSKIFHVSLQVIIDGKKELIT